MNYAIILSSGVGSRMKSDIPKQYIKYKGKPIIIDTASIFQKCKSIDGLIIVCADSWKSRVREWSDKFGLTKLLSIVTGGESRQESIFNGLKYCMGISQSDNDKVVIHDAVRPFVREETILECLNYLGKYDGVMPAIPVKDTIYQCANGKTITSLLDRDSLFAGQSPEAFILHRYYNVHLHLSERQLSEIRGSSEIAVQHDLNIKVIEGDESNFKITTPIDLKKYYDIKEQEK